MQVDALGGEPFGDAETDAARTAGNECRAALKIEFHAIPPSKMRRYYKQLAAGVPARRRAAVNLPYTYTLLNSSGLRIH